MDGATLMANPKPIVTPFAETGVKNDIPESGASAPQLATMSAGFPTVTQTPINEGGIPPERADFNGLGYLTTSHLAFLNRGQWYGYDANLAGQAGGYPLHARLMLENGDIVRSTIPNNTNNPNVNMTGWIVGVPSRLVVDDSGATQQEINNKRLIVLSSVIDFNSTPIKPNCVYQTKSYIAGTNFGSCMYKYDETILKSNHNGGTIIDPSIVFTTLSDFLAKKTTSGQGCFVALNVEREIPVEIFGARPLSSFVENDIPINAAIGVASASSVSEPPRIVTIGAGEYRTSKAIVNTSLWHIVPPHIKGAGREATKIIKVTNSALGSGYLADSSVDAVLVSSPLTDNPEGGNAYLISESVKGLSLKHITETAESIGWYRHRSAMGYVDDIYSETHNTHFVFNDCWMTNFGQLWAHGGEKGYVFNVATSLRGGWLYATSTKGRAFLFDKVIYSDIKCCADHCGLDGDTGATAYRFVDCKGVSGKFNGENHRGELFSFTGSYGLSIGGQDWRAKAVANTASVPRIYASYAIVKFIGYDFLESSAALSVDERKNYEFVQRDDISTIEFDAVSLPQSPYGTSLKTPYRFAVSGSFNSKQLLANYSQLSRNVQHTLMLTTDFQQLCYVAESSRIKINSANSTDPSQPLFIYVDNQINREVGIKLSSISTNSTSPTEIATIYADDDRNPDFSTKLLAYVDNQGYLNVKAQGTGFSVHYAFNINI